MFIEIYNTYLPINYIVAEAFPSNVADGGIHFQVSRPTSYIQHRILNWPLKTDTSYNYNSASLDKNIKNLHLVGQELNKCSDTLMGEMDFEENLYTKHLNTEGKAIVVLFWSINPKRQTLLAGPFCTAIFTAYPAIHIHRAKSLMLQK